MKYMRIAEKLTIRQWKELDKILNNKENVCWEYAFRFFEERIETRYLKPIEAILNMGDNKGEGFAVVNLQCSLIETIESFIQGCYSEFNKKKRFTEWKKRNGDIIFTSNKKIFHSFFSKRSEFVKYKISGKEFYKDVRCGLLHETQTKKGWLILTDTEKSNYSYQEKNNFKIIYREIFQLELRNLIERYGKAIIEGKDFDEISNKEDLRQNFRDKFNHICKQS